MKVKVIILRVAGTNCDFETEFAFKLAGAFVERIHINQIIRKEKKLSDYQILVIPGGFSYGDDIAAGKVLANQIKLKLWEEIENFISQKKAIIGICNGFQVLVKSGILPFNSKQLITLEWNDSGRFEDRWVYLKVEESVSPFFKGLPDIIRMPVAHAEGKFLPKNNKVLNEIEKNKQVILRYCDKKGNLVNYPYNPNGSIGNIAGICSKDGLIIGMMPHPERAILRYYYPDFLKNEEKEEFTPSFKIFKNMVKYFS
ncbi:MAG: phosphoribosylformylglycinamidine synthase I [Candidatus Omnitrophica bacterium]|nr:phosphoribosylformylglycinamidine synthase I [Candidatus Omnitrophota bacterium]MCM8809177.1 phosphoribosylformylglycinamidine synthase I [Candidatus Omnitrophota bacterium]MCM8810465.1 phosphoribosylformylglycinamidine synthase I [Candidatus Omnitrophota bacterium]